MSLAHVDLPHPRFLSSCSKIEITEQNHYFFNKVAILGWSSSENKTFCWLAEMGPYGHPSLFWNIFAKFKTHFFEAPKKAFTVSVYFNKKKTRTMIRLSLKCCNLVKTDFSEWIFFHAHIKYACKIRAIWSFKAIHRKHYEYGILKVQN